MDMKEEIREIQHQMDDEGNHRIVVLSKDSKGKETLTKGEWALYTSPALEQKWSLLALSSYYTGFGTQEQDVSVVKVQILQSVEKIVKGVRPE